MWLFLINVPRKKLLNIYSIDITFIKKCIKIRKKDDFASGKAEFHS